MKTDELIKAMNEAKTEQSFQEASDVLLEYFAVATEPEKELLRAAILKNAEDLLLESQRSRQEADKLIAEYESGRLAIDVEKH